MLAKDIKWRWERSKDPVLYRTASLKRTPCSKGPSINYVVSKFAIFYTKKRGIFKAVEGLGTVYKGFPT